MPIGDELYERARHRSIARQQGFILLSLQSTKFLSIYDLLPTMLKILDCLWTLRLGATRLAALDLPIRLSTLSRYERIPWTDEIAFYLTCVTYANQAVKRSCKMVCMTTIGCHRMALNL